MSQGNFNAGRRAFLSGAPLSREGRQQYRRLHRPLGPVLPGLSDDVNPAMCATCDGPCATACPTRIVLRHGREHTLTGIPYLSFDRAGCNYCGACVEACPHIAGPVNGQPVLGTARLNPQACLACNGVVCISCVPRCPQGSLHRDARGRIQVDTDSCNGCGACVSVCPVGALSVAAIAGVMAAGEKPLSKSTDRQSGS
jgi:ferredoxin-type protein NapF